MFAMVALIAAGGGLFGVLSYAVQQRRREFGVRASLGATPMAIARIVIREGVVVAATGLLLGVLLARGFASTMASLEYGVTVADPAISLIVAATVLTAVLAALWQPTRAAGRTDPARLLKED
jgi:ABC-type antimicrobial peptide transport system permease subunit